MSSSPDFSPYRANAVPEASRKLHRDRYRVAYTALIVAAASVTVGLTGCAPSGDSGGDERIVIALIEPDLTTVPLMAAADSMREQGYDVEIVELAEPELAIEGLAKGDYAISAEATSPALVAIERGAPIKIIADVIGNQWAVYGNESVTTCDDLVGAPMGIFSEGAVATAMVRSWVAEECTTGEPEYLVIGGSDVRAQALLSGQIDGTALEIADVVTLNATGAEFNQVIDFGKLLPHLHPQTVYANTDFLEQSSEAAQAFVTALIDEHAAINADPGYLVELAEKYLGAGPDDTLMEVANTYVDAGLFDAAALTPENVQGTIDFFTEAGIIGNLDADAAADLRFLK